MLPAAVPMETRAPVPWALWRDHQDGYAAPLEQQLSRSSCGDGRWVRGEAAEMGLSNTADSLDAAAGSMFGVSSLDVGNPEESDSNSATMCAASEPTNGGASISGSPCCARRMLFARGLEKLFCLSGKTIYPGGIFRTEVS